MAQQTVVRLVDDLDDTVIQDGEGQTVKFGLDGTSYEIDLTNTHADELREAVSRYVQAGRKLGTTRTAAVTGSSRGPARRDREQTQAIRDWAKAQGMEVSERGRIPKTVLDAYNAASK